MPPSAAVKRKIAAGRLKFLFFSRRTPCLAHGLMVSYIRYWDFPEQGQYTIGDAGQAIDKPICLCIKTDNSA
ncbi:hypothetical protein DW194_05450 [Subdoligranulum sp. AM16-9]|nr:hypothetical protein DW194_05450 [Subdoligranulum sp. AM16-9]RJW02743.1 hypothetical protein DWW15_03685 [Subdoligranulum sp. AF14-43]